MAANPMVIVTVSLVENHRLYDQPGFDRTHYFPEPTSNCTFTLEDGFQFPTASSYELIPQAVTAISCVPINGSSFEAMTNAQSTTSTISATPPYPTASSIISTAGNGTTAVSSTAGASNTAAAPGRGENLVPFTGGATSVRTLCSITNLALLAGFWILR